MSNPHHPLKSALDQLVQRKTIGQLKHAAVSPFITGSLRKCSAIKCGRTRCLAVCAFGASRHRRHVATSVQQLLQQHEGPFFELRISKSNWGCDLGSLPKLSLEAAKRMSRRALDKLLDTEILAVGVLKPSISPQPSGDRWRLEIHQIVAGATRDQLNHAFAGNYRSDDDFVLINKVKDLKEAVERMVHQDLQAWAAPSYMDEQAQVSAAARAEFLLWQLSLGNGALTLRYGIDQHFNKLTKAPRTLRAPKARKPRPYPFWLEPFQFGSETRAKMELWKEQDASNRRLWK